MNYLVDSDWVADWLKGRPPAVRLLLRLSADGIAISSVTYGEIYEASTTAVILSRTSAGFAGSCGLLPCFP